MLNLEKLRNLILSGKLLSEKTFNVCDIDLILDNRDEEEFDNQWIRNFNEINEKEQLINGENKELIQSIREKVFKIVYNSTQSSELAGYVSDDFDLISKALVLNYNDDWLNSLFKSYVDGKIPQGKLKSYKGNLNEVNYINKKYIIEFKYITGQDKLEEVKQLFLEYSKSLKIDLSFQNFETELSELPGKYSSPEGALILSLVDGQVAGCIALRKNSDGICEMKRLYVREMYRELGIGRKLISMIIEEAKKLNYSFMRLDTLSTMKNAQNLYESFGFYEIEPYIYNPIEGARFMELKLKY